MTTTNLLYKYQNGNVEVCLYEDGTKTQEWDDNEIPNPIYPNSMDIKITNSCDLGCEFCHEMSTIDGKHADLHKLLNLLKDLPKGTELAIGGGNPLFHPDLTMFLEACKDLELIPNMTVNYVHAVALRNQLNYLLGSNLIYGLGISISSSFIESNINKLVKLENAVYHVIAGVSSISILDKIAKSSIKKVLILGYKEVGRGINYFDPEVEQIKQEWFDNIHKYIGKIHLSFDNLAIKQLNIRRFFTEKSWNNFYMGTDGQFTMYIDAVEEKYAVSSTSSEKIPITENIKDIFTHVKQTILQP